MTTATAAKPLVSFGDASSSSVTITLWPPVASVSASHESSPGWIPGVQACYPAATASFAAEQARAMKPASPKAVAACTH